MKKTLLTAVLTATLFTTGFNTVKDVTANASSKTLSTYMYQFKKVGKHIKLTKSTHIKTTKTLTRGKAITYFGTKYYYCKQIHGYLLKPDFNYKNKKTSKVTKHYDNNNTTNNTASNTSTNNSSNNDVIKNGFDETTSTVTDKNTYINVFTQTVLNDINMYRTQKGLQPVTQSQQLQNVASVRAQQVYSNLSHFNQNGQALGALEATNEGVFSSYNDAQYHLSENIAAPCLNPSSQFEDPVTTGHNAVQLAIDEGTNGGHYKDMMSPDNKQIGIGLYIGTNQGANTNIGYAEEYTH